MYVTRATIYEAYFDFNDLKTSVEKHEEIIDFLHNSYRGGKDNCAESYDCPACVGFRFNSTDKKYVDSLVRKVKKLLKTP